MTRDELNTIIPVGSSFKFLDKEASDDCRVEVDNYLNKGCHRRDDKNFGVLKWWKLNSSRFLKAKFVYWIIFGTHFLPRHQKLSFVLKIGYNLNLIWLIQVIINRIYQLDQGSTLISFYCYIIKHIYCNYLFFSHSYDFPNFIKIRFKVFISLTNSF